MQLLGVNQRLTTITETSAARLIHAHFIRDALRIVRFASSHRLPLVVTAHGYDATMGVKYLGRREHVIDIFSRHHFHSKVAAVICVSDFIRNELESRGFPPEKLRTLPLGVNISALPKPAPQDSRKGVLFVERLVEKKGAAI